MLSCYPGSCPYPSWVYGTACNAPRPEEQGLCIADPVVELAGLVWGALDRRPVGLRGSTQLLDRALSLPLALSRVLGLPLVLVSTAKAAAYVLLAAPCTSSTLRPAAPAVLLDATNGC